MSFFKAVAQSVKQSLHVFRWASRQGIQQAQQQVSNTATTGHGPATDSQQEQQDRPYLGNPETEEPLPIPDKLGPSDSLSLAYLASTDPHTSKHATTAQATLHFDALRATQSALDDITASYRTAGDQAGPTVSGADSPQAGQTILQAIGSTTAATAAVQGFHSIFEEPSVPAVLLPAVELALQPVHGAPTGPAQAGQAAAQPIGGQTDVTGTAAGHSLHDRPGLPEPPADQPTDTAPPQTARTTSAVLSLHVLQLASAADPVANNGAQQIPAQPAAAAQPAHTALDVPAVSLTQAVLAADGDDAVQDTFDVSSQQPCAAVLWSGNTASATPVSDQLGSAVPAVWTDATNVAAASAVQHQGEAGSSSAQSADVMPAVSAVQQPDEAGSSSAQSADVMPAVSAVQHPDEAERSRVQSADVMPAVSAVQHPDEAGSYSAQSADIMPAVSAGHSAEDWLAATNNRVADIEPMADVMLAAPVVASPFVEADPAVGPTQLVDIVPVQPSVTSLAVPASQPASAEHSLPATQLSQLVETVRATSAVPHATTRITESAAPVIQPDQTNSVTQLRDGRSEETAGQPRAVLCATSASQLEHQGLAPHSTEADGLVASAPTPPQTALSLLSQVQCKTYEHQLTEAVSAPSARQLTPPASAVKPSALVGGCMEQQAVTADSLKLQGTGKSHVKHSENASDAKPSSARLVASRPLSDTSNVNLMPIAKSQPVKNRRTIKQEEREQEKERKRQQRHVAQSCGRQMVARFTRRSCVSVEDVQAYLDDKDKPEDNAAAKETTSGLLSKQKTRQSGRTCKHTVCDRVEVSVEELLARIEGPSEQAGSRSVQSTAGHRQQSEQSQVFCKQNLEALHKGFGNVSTDAQSEDEEDGASNEDSTTTLVSTFGRIYESGAGQSATNVQRPGRETRYADCRHDWDNTALVVSTQNYTAVELQRGKTVVEKHPRNVNMELLLSHGMFTYRSPPQQWSIELHVTDEDFNKGIRICGREAGAAGHLYIDVVRKHFYDKLYGWDEPGYGKVPHGCVILIPGRGKGLVMKAIREMVKAHPFAAEFAVIHDGGALIAKLVRPD